MHFYFPNIKKKFNNNFCASPYKLGLCKCLFRYFVIISFEILFFLVQF